jgi:hypothetical protein
MTTQHLGRRRHLPLQRAALAVASMLVLALTPGSARGQQITSVQGIDGLSQAVIGTKLYIQGGDFGQQKPKVTLTDPTTGKVYKLKVTQHGQSHAYAQIKKAVVGDLQLALLPKGAEEPVLADEPVTILAPSLKLLADAPALGQLSPHPPDSMVHVSGSNFGHGKLKARVGGKPAKVFWPSIDEPHGPDSAYVFIKKKMPPGEHLLELLNGVATCSAPIWIKPGPKHPDTLDPAQVSLQLVIEGVPLPMQVAHAQLGSTVSLASGEARPFLILDAKEPVSQLELHVQVRLGDGAQAPAVLAAPYLPVAGAADVQFLVGAPGSGNWPWDPGDSSPKPLTWWTPLESFTFTLAQLDPLQHTAQAEFGGPLGSESPSVASIAVVGSVSIAP